MTAITPSRIVGAGDRWQFGVPPVGNANFAWVQHFIHHLAPHGYAGFVLANGSLSSQQSGEGEIRRAIVDADLVDCIVSLPGQLFFTTQIPVCLWFMTRDKSNGLVRDMKLRDRRRETLFIDARGLGTMQGRTLKVLTDEEIAKVADIWIGRHVRNTFSLYTHNAVTMVRNDSDAVFVDGLPVSNAQTSTFSVGDHLFFHVMSSQFAESIMRRYRLPLVFGPATRQIWPVRDSLVAWPPQQTLNDLGVSELANEFFHKANNLAREKASAGR